MGKLDTVTVNGPEGDVVDWDAVDWRRVEDDVRRLRQRIFTATQAGDLKKVRNLQKLMLRSRANTLFSVRQVTQRNAGRKTAGVDGRGRARGVGEGRVGHLAVSTARPAWRPQPVKRVYIPKAKRKTTPTRDSRHHRSGASSPGGPCAGTRVGGPVRTPLVWVSAGPWLPGRDRRDLHDVQEAHRAKRVWALDADLAAAWMRCHTAPFADCHDQNSPSWVGGGWIRRPFRRPVRTCTALSSPRLTRCMMVWRDTP